MREIEKLTCINIYKRLRERVKGKVFTGIQDDILTVYINGGRDLRFTYTVKNVSKEILEKRINCRNYC